MTAKGKSLSDLTGGSVPSLGTKSVVDQMIDMQRTVDRLGGFGLKLEQDKLSLMAQGLTSPGTQSILDRLSGNYTGISDQTKYMSLVEQASIGASLRIHDPFEKYGSMRRAIEEAMGKIMRFEDSAFGRAHETAAKLALFRGHNFGSGLDERISEAMKRIMEPSRSLTLSQSALLGIDRIAAADFDRSRHWASILGTTSTKDYSSLLGLSGSTKELEALRLAAGSIADATAGLGISDLFKRAMGVGEGLGAFSDTATKLSLFAGTLDVFGPRAGANEAAYRALMGGYETGAMLDRAYWRDPLERARYYRDHEVDEGLIDAENAETVAVLIESGVVEGRRTRAGTVTAVVEAGPIKVRIIASRPRLGAYQAIDAIETGLRTFVAAKLSAAQGPHWFKQRVPGEIANRAKDRRREAMRAGEPQLELIHYTDLGDMIAMITRKDNWSEIFEAVFIRPDWFKVDLERLTAHRRTPMHARPVDAVQLIEILLNVRRLVEAMERDGCWDAGWDADI